MTSKKTNETYSVMAKVVVDTDVEISAPSLEEALIKARKLYIHDFVKILGSHNDSGVEVKGVWKL